MFFYLFFFIFFAVPCKCTFEAHFSPGPDIVWCKYHVTSECNPVFDRNWMGIVVAHRFRFNGLERQVCTKSITVPMCQIINCSSLCSGH